MRRILVRVAAQILAPHPQPDSLHAVELGQVRRQPEERDVLPHLQPAAAEVPAPSQTSTTCRSAPSIRERLHSRSFFTAAFTSGVITPGSWPVTGFTAALPALVVPADPVLHRAAADREGLGDLPRGSRMTARIRSQSRKYRHFAASDSGINGARGGTRAAFAPTPPRSPPSWLAKRGRDRPATSRSAPQSPHLRASDPGHAALPMSVESMVFPCLGRQASSVCYPGLFLAYWALHRTMDPQEEITRLVTRLGTGDALAAEGLAAALYEELRQIAQALMRGERADHTLQATALVSEAYLRLVDQTRVDWRGETHFRAVAAQAMRRVLVDHARARRRHKRQGDRRRLMLETNLAEPAPAVDILELDDLLEKLRALDEQQHRIVEMRLFSDMELKQIAFALGLPMRTVQYDWRMARAWLSSQLVDGAEG